MKITRKNFLRLLGGSALAAVAGKFAKTVQANAAGSSAPLSAQRWAMAIDYAKCPQDCNDCSRACHAAHNVPKLANPAHAVKWIWRAAYEKLFPAQQAGLARPELAGALLPALCNHCADPPCVRVCPTQATWKRLDGVVMMDYHRCIGCRYCMAGCPYGSRSFNWEEPKAHIERVNPDFPTRTRGVVEKCNFCEERLAEGKPPACVEACPQKAMIFGDLKDPNSAIRQTLRTRNFQQRRPELGTGPSVFYLI